MCRARVRAHVFFPAVPIPFQISTYRPPIEPAGVASVFWQSRPPSCAPAAGPGTWQGPKKGEAVLVRVTKVLPPRGSILDAHFLQDRKDRQAAAPLVLVEGRKRTRALWAGRRKDGAHNGLCQGEHAMAGTSPGQGGTGPGRAGRGRGSGTGWPLRSVALVGRCARADFGQGRRNRPFVFAHEVGQLQVLLGCLREAAFVVQDAGKADLRRGSVARQEVSVRQ